MANEYFKRFVYEVMEEPTRYDYYLRNPLMIQDKFRKFIHTQEQNNKHFAKIIVNKSFLKTTDIIFETILNQDIDNISDYLDNKEKIKILSSYGTIEVPKNSIPLITGNTCYISNGVYGDTKDIVEQIINYSDDKIRPSFIVGVVDQLSNSTGTRKITTPFYEENFEKVKKLQKELKKRNVSLTTYKENREDYNAYLLVGRGD